MDKKRFVYADNAATTRVSDKVFAIMQPYFSNEFANPNSIYSFAHTARNAIEDARRKTTDAINAKNGNVYFTSGGTESDNWAITGVAAAESRKGKKHIISTKVEHYSVLNALESLKKQGFEITLLEADAEGMITPDQVEKAIREDTALVSVMYANNEIGTIYPIADIGAICRKRNVLFHTDAVQAMGCVKIDVENQNIDLLTLSGHKFHAPKGIGCLYVRKGIALNNLIHGGGQEKGKRPGTENVPYITGFAEAVSIAANTVNERVEYVTNLRDKLLEGILTIPGVKINGTMKQRLCGNINVSLEAIEGESILLALDMKGIFASSGSACTSGSLDPSHVLLAIGLPHALAHGSLRFTLNEENTMEDVEYILEHLPPIVQNLRNMSPLWREKGG
ncbi:MAG: cysteine desulfurase NifS [Oscillospiraceae bacterium]|nr:cysteine desulfurase NifS [Oscillospiraceae bacterium]